MVTTNRQGVAVNSLDLRTPSDACICLIQHFEGLRLDAYWDAAGGVWTIGFGHTGNVAQGQRITREAALDLLAQDIHAAQTLVRQACAAVDLTQGQFDALVSFVFNVGAGRRNVKPGFAYLLNGKPSTLLTKLRTGDTTGAADEFLKWVYAGGKRLPGLVRRRRAERELFLTGRWTA